MAAALYSQVMAVIHYVYCNPPLYNNKQLLRDTVEHTCESSLGSCPVTVILAALIRRWRHIHQAADTEEATSWSQGQQVDRAYQSQTACHSAPNTPLPYRRAGGPCPSQPAGKHGHVAESATREADAHRHSGQSIRLCLLSHVLRCTEYACPVRRRFITAYPKPQALLLPFCCLSNRYNGCYQPSGKPMQSSSRL